MLPSLQALFPTRRALRHQVHVPCICPKVPVMSWMETLSCCKAWSKESELGCKMAFTAWTSAWRRDSVRQCMSIHLWSTEVGSPGRAALCLLDHVARLPWGVVLNQIGREVLLRGQSLWSPAGLTWLGLSGSFPGCFFLSLSGASLPHFPPSFFWSYHTWASFLLLCLKSAHLHSSTLVWWKINLWTAHFQSPVISSLHFIWTPYQYLILFP